MCVCGVFGVCLGVCFCSVCVLCEYVVCGVLCDKCVRVVFVCVFGVVVVCVVCV